MKFEKPLIQATLLKRYKRFLADVELESGQETTVYCPNPGSMLGLMDPGSDVWLSEASPEGGRKHLLTWEIVRAENTLVGIHTGRTNDLVEEALREKRVSELAHYDSWRREVKYGSNSRIDFLLEGNGLSPCYLEVKNVHLKRFGQAQFPDSVTTRGTKHLGELAAMKDAGARALIFYVVQREDCEVFSLASDIDKVYAKTAKEAYTRGVEPLCYACHVTKDEIKIAKQLEIIKE